MATPEHPDPSTTEEKYSLEAGTTPLSEDVVLVSTKRVRCSGPGGALGHPMVWLDMGLADRVECKYCDRVFVFDGKLKDGDGNART